MPRVRRVRCISDADGRVPVGAVALRRVRRVRRAGAGVPRCCGAGFRVEAGEASIDIPKGAEDGARITVDDEGDVGVCGTRGDLVAIIRVEDDDQFYRRGADLILKTPLKVSLRDALGGCAEINVCRAPRQFFTKSSPAMMRRVLAPSSGEEWHRHAIEQASRRWRGGRRGDSGRTRRQFDFHTWRHSRRQRRRRSTHPCGSAPLRE